MATTNVASPTAVTSEAASVIARLAGHPGGILALAFSHDRGLLASSGRDGITRLWDLGSGNPGERCTLGTQGRRIQSLTFAPNGKSIACGSGSLDGTIWIFDLTATSPREAVVLRSVRGAIYALEYSPDGILVAGAGEDRIVRFWEPGSGRRIEPLAQMIGHTGPIRGLTFAPDGQEIATAADDSTVRLWAISRIRSAVRVLLPHPVGVTAVAFTPDGRTLVTGARDGIIRLWDPASSTALLRAELIGQSAAIRMLSITSDGRTLVSIADEPKMIRFDLATGFPVHEWRLPITPKPAVAVTRDGRYLALGRDNGAAELLRVADKR